MKKFIAIGLLLLASAVQARTVTYSMAFIPAADSIRWIAKQTGSTTTSATGLVNSDSVTAHNCYFTFSAADALTYDMTIKYWYTGSSYASVQTETVLPTVTAKIPPENKLSNGDFEQDTLGSHTLSKWTLSPHVSGSPGTTHIAARTGATGTAYDSMTLYNSRGNDTVRMTQDSIWLNGGFYEIGASIYAPFSIYHPDTVQIGLQDSAGTFTAYLTYLGTDVTSWYSWKTNLNLAASGRYAFVIRLFTSNSTTVSQFYIDDCDLHWLGPSVTATATVSDEDKAEIAHLVKLQADSFPSSFYGPTNAGSGIYTLTVRCMDTSSAPDSTMIGGAVSLYTDTSDVPAGNQTVPVSGLTRFNVNSGTYILKGAKVGYLLDSQVVTITGNRTDTLRGRSNVRTNKCYVWGNIGTLTGGTGAYLTLTMPEGNVNSCDTMGIITRSAYTYSDPTTGYFQFPNPVPYSSCFNDVAYDLTIAKAGSMQGKKIKVTVPDSATYRITTF